MASMLEEGFYCVPESQLLPAQRVAYCGLSLASGLAGLAGAACQAAQWRPFLRTYGRRRRPSPNPMVVVSLAVADVLACLGVVLRSTTMLVTVPPVPGVNSTLYHPLDGSMPLIVTGHAVEVINQYFYGVTFMWTIIYALDILLQLLHKEVSCIVYHAICWITPALTTIGSIVAIAKTPGSPHTCAYGRYLITRYVFSFILILLAMVINPLIYICCNKKIDRRMRESGLMDNHNQAVMAALRRKYLTVTMIFTLCWFPNIVDASILIMAAGIGASPSSMAQFFPLWAIEAVLNPLQGLLNCLVYGRHMQFRRIRRNEAGIHQPEETTEETPILYNHRGTGNLFASE